jgi:hypothetical protein
MNTKTENFLRGELERASDVLNFAEEQEKKFEARIEEARRLLRRAWGACHQTGRNELAKEIETWLRS